MIYKVTFGFRGQGSGWTENHAVRSSTTAPADLATGAIAIAQKRVTFLGREFELNGIRISKYSNDAGTTRDRGTYLVSQVFKNPVQTASQAAEPKDVALISVASTNSQLAPPGLVANQARNFLGAPPDPAVDDGGIVYPAQSNLGTNFAQWAALMVQSGYGWLAQTTTVEYDIDSISQNANGTVELIVKNPTGTPATVGQTYYGRIRRVNGGQSPLNGEIIVQMVAPLTFNTQEIIGLALAQTGGKIRLYTPVQPFVPYARIDLRLEVGKHQRGRPFGSSPGRQRRRIRG